jgi:enoyl-CoA hydratase
MPVLVETPEARVTVVTIDRQERRNAVDREAAEAIRHAASEARGIVVLTGAGGHFCAGADLTTLEDSAFAALVRDTCDALGRSEIVSIAAVDGAALGAGTQFAAACDLRVATSAARFGVPAGKLGVALDGTTVSRLAAVAGGGPARAMLLGGDVLDGETAHRLGFVQRLGGLDDAIAWAREIAALAPLTLTAHKLGLDGGDASAAYDRAWSSNDLREGLAAFQEKRPPKFQGH